MPRVSHSEVSSYLRCKRQHYYGYGLSLEQKIPTAPGLAMGSAGHKVLEAFYREILEAGDSNKKQRAAFDKALNVAKIEFNKIIDEGFRGPDNRADLADILFVWYFPNERFVKQGWAVMAVEEEFILEYDNTDEANPLQFPFIVDLILRDPDGKIVVVDHKFLYDFMSYEETEFQTQIPKYIGALRGLNHKIDYGAYNQLRTRKIVGTKSKANPEGAGPTLIQALDFMPIHPNTVRVQTTFIEQIGVAAEIQERKNLPLDVLDKVSYRSMGPACNFCNFKEICTIEMNGGNAKLMLQTEYKTRERKQFAEEASEDA